MALAGVNASADGSAIGVYGSVSNGSAVYGVAPSGNGVFGTSTAGNGVYGTSGSASGVYGSSGSGNGVYGTSSGGSGVYGLTVGQYGVNGISSGTGTGVNGYSYNGNGVVGTARAAGVGVRGNSGGGIGVYGVIGSPGFLAYPAAVLAESDGSADALQAYTGDSTAGYFLNISDSRSTLVANNNGKGSTNSLYKIFYGRSSTGSCGIGDGGNLTCTGQMKALVTTGSQCQVETYSVQSSENWLEDYGSGTLADGKAVIQLDAAFADAANTAVTYHVFLTPEGDAQPLFVTHKTADSFEVNESGKGSSSIGFSCRIVAKRRGVEEQRLVDVTEKLKAEIEAIMPREART